MMKGNVRKFHVKARRLMRLYSLWHETNREEIKNECLSLLREIQNVRPQFSLRNEFQKAF